METEAKIIEVRLERELEAQRKEEERQEEEERRTKEIHDAGYGNGIFFIEEAPLAFETQDPNIEWYMKAAAAVQNAIQCYCIIYDEEKKSYYLD